MIHALVFGLAALLYAVSALAGGLVITVAPSVDLFGIDLAAYAPGALASWTLAASLLAYYAWRLRRRAAPSA